MHIPIKQIKDAHNIQTNKAIHTPKKGSPQLRYWYKVHTIDRVVHVQSLPQTQRQCDSVKHSHLCAPSSCGSGCFWRYGICCCGGLARTRCRCCQWHGSAVGPGTWRLLLWLSPTGWVLAEEESRAELDFSFVVTFVNEGRHWQHVSGHKVYIWCKKKTVGN